MIAGPRDASYQLFDGLNSLGTIVVDQHSPPTGTSLDGRNWDSLGTFQIDSGELVVELDNNANGSVVADAVRLRPVGAPQVPTQLTSLDLTGNPLGNTVHDVSSAAPGSGSCPVRSE